MGKQERIKLKHLLCIVTEDTAATGLCDMIHPLWDIDNTRNLKMVDNKDGTCKAKYVLYRETDTQKNVMRVSISLEKNENLDGYQHLERTEQEIMDSGMVIYEAGDDDPDIDIHTAAIHQLY